MNESEQEDDIFELLIQETDHILTELEYLRKKREQCIFRLERRDEEVLPIIPRKLILLKPSIIHKLLYKSGVLKKNDDIDYIIHWLIYNELKYFLLRGSIISEEKGLKTINLTDVIEDKHYFL